jgi:predicted nucleotidyltransferase
MKKLIKRLKGLLKNKDILDIIVFGSKSKNKISPNDIDIAILSKEKDFNLLSSIKKDFPEADVQLITLADIGSDIMITLIKEGYSIKKENYLHNSYNLKPVKLYKYNLKTLTPSKKVMFERGIKKIKNIEKLSNSVVLVPIEISGEFEDFLRNWNLDIDAKEYELVPIMRKEF